MPGSTRISTPISAASRPRAGRPAGASSGSSPNARAGRSTSAATAARRRSAPFTTRPAPFRPRPIRSGCSTPACPTGPEALARDARAGPRRPRPRLAAVPRRRADRLSLGAGGRLQPLIYAHLGYDPDFADHSPGTVLQLEAMRQLMAERAFRPVRLHRGRRAAQAPVRDRRHRLRRSAAGQADAGQSARRPCARRRSTGRWRWPRRRPPRSASPGRCAGCGAEAAMSLRRFRSGRRRPTSVLEPGFRRRRSTSVAGRRTPPFPAPLLVRRGRRTSGRATLVATRAGGTVDRRACRPSPAGRFGAARRPRLLLAVPQLPGRRATRTTRRSPPPRSRAPDGRSAAPGGSGRCMDDDPTLARLLRVARRCGFTVLARRDRHLLRARHRGGARGRALAEALDAAQPAQA